ncbi:YgiW/YdeI family stress tolerance OB fold protein [Atlantibacter sp.]|uniref:YgiW/YdeI family stress tolerance OB fold protein n=1 Tax=Atlantibacter sp. TaxID=1903473 RepID=UPI00289FC25D|nr:YgiW/YdeI family stress tolerance OB fold protein [Atlantibacter sp.]
MKKAFVAASLAAGLLFSVTAFAQQGGGFTGPDATKTQDAQTTPNSQKGGFVGPDTATTTVEQAKSLRDDAWVVLEGNIVRKVGKELYEFRDSTGTINVDIDDDHWGGVSVTPNDKVRIEGEVDKDWNSVEIDAKKVTKG